jgi:hypothetical protein
MVEVKFSEDEEGTPIALVPIRSCELSPCINYETGKACGHVYGMEGGPLEEGEPEFVVCSKAWRSGAD